jgi:uncharacterized membrane protein
MRKLFFAGLVSLLPFTLTLLIVIFVVNFFTNPFQGVVESVLDHYDLLDKPFLFFSGDQILYFSSKLLALIVVLSMIIFIGFLGHQVMTKAFFRFSDYLIHRIPIINKLYKPVQEVVHTLLKSKKGTTFSQAALVPFPHSGAYSLGLIGTKEESKDVLVFIPGTPNPTGGFMLVFKREKVIFLDMKVEDAIKFVISCGTMNPGFE